MEAIFYYDVNNTETAKFNIANLNEKNGIDSIANSEFKKIAESSHAIVYIQNGKSFDMNNVKKFFSKFEANYYEELRIYGEPISFPSINNDKLVFLIYNFYPGAKGNFAGFFNPSDFYDNKPDTINKGKYMYVNISRISNPDSVVSTMLHEFQHLINDSVNLMNVGKAMDLWLNEALSESTSVLFTPIDANDRKDFFNKIPYYSFYSWKIDEIMVGVKGDQGKTLSSLYFSYCSSSVFMRWIEHVGGRETIKTIAHSDPSLDTRSRLVNSIKGLNIGNNVEEIFVSWIKDIYKGNLPGVEVRKLTFDPNINTLITDKGLALAPGGFIIYDANEYNLDDVQGLGLGTKVFDESKNLYLVWNPKFDSVDVEGKINANDVIWIKPTKISPTPSSSKSEMLNFGGSIKK